MSHQQQSTKTMTRNASFKKKKNNNLKTIAIPLVPPPKMSYYSSSSSSSSPSSSSRSDSSSYSSNNSSSAYSNSYVSDKENTSQNNSGSSDGEEEEEEKEEDNYYIKINELKKKIKLQDRYLHSLQKQIKQLKIIVQDVKNHTNFFWAFVANKNGLKLYDSLPEQEEQEEQENKNKDFDKNFDKNKKNDKNDKKKIQEEEKNDNLVKNVKFPTTCMYPYKKVLKIMEPFVEKLNENSVMCIWARAQFVGFNEPIFKELWCPIKIDKEYQVEMFHLRDNYHLPVEMLNLDNN